MSVLLAVTDYTQWKAYCRPAFWKMMAKCVYPLDDVAIAVASDQHSYDVGHWDYYSPMTPGKAMVEDIIMDSREQQRKIAVEEGFDKIMWQGLDAPWRSQEDVERILSHDLDIVGPVINARTFPGMAVARRFLVKSKPSVVRSYEDGFPGFDQIQFSEEQEDITHEEIMSGELVPAGFPGGDNIVIKRDVFEQFDWWSGGHKPWYARVANGEANVDCIEWYCLNALNAGYSSWLDTSVHVWHIDGDTSPPTARLYPDVNIPLDDVRDWD